MKQEHLQSQANVLALEMKRDRLLEALEAITAEIYSAVKRVELIEAEMGGEDEGLPA